MQALWVSDPKTVSIEDHKVWMFSMPKSEAFCKLKPNQIALKHNIVTIIINAEAAEHFETWAGSSYTE